MPTTAQERKQHVLAELVDARTHLLDLATSVAPERRETIFLGSWTLTDLIAHLIGWDFTNIQAMHDLLADQLPQFYRHHDHDWQTYNAQLVCEHRTDDFAELLARAKASHHQLIALLQTIGAEEFDRDRGVRFKGWKVTMARLLEAEADDERKHCTQIQQFIDQEGLSSAEASDHTATV
jgi:Protein of unknown function (DUF1706)